MAESTGNAIPNQKNSQKHVVIIPIDVHHRHDSQVSQILDPDKASDITKAQQKNLEGKKKTPAERMREYRARKKVRIRSTSDSPSVVHHQEMKMLLCQITVIFNVIELLLKISKLNLLKIRLVVFVQFV
ncbi:hypothetical protein TNCT_178181 [Trichonephila clavata]|uniref:Uncharacterized protein n=1 Tax=Trichonephila clavata TaxID=2740835 RepID=A0A8X6HF73_TRICU|nr:hypothetical protein TNCT_178181 [Trichonephila clavata]